MGLKLAFRSPGRFDKTDFLALPSGFLQGEPENLQEQFPGNSDVSLGEPLV